ncbi:MAG: hypothetical protein ABSE07_04515 [Methanoregula sp.]
MTFVTDEDMRKRMAQTKEYCVVILKAGPNRHRTGVEKIIWEHGRRNFALREVDRVRVIMDEDPGVREGVFVYEIHACRSFPGDCLPG